MFVAGTGNPYFTTDTAAALRAVEINAEVLLKATKVDGVYDRDPMVDPAAQRYASLGYGDLLRDQLKVMDATAVSLCMENDLPIVVFDLNSTGQHHAGRQRRTRRDADLGHIRLWRCEGMSNEILDRCGPEDGSRRRSHGTRLPGDAHRPGVDVARRAASRRVLRHVHAAQPAGRHQRSRAPSDRHPALGPGRPRRHREGDPEERHRPDPERGRDGRASQHPAA